MASTNMAMNVKDRKKMKTVVYGRIRDHLPINFLK